MKSNLENGIEWLWNHKPDIAFVGIIVACAVWITTTVNTFDRRLYETERLCSDINERQLPEVRQELKEIRVEIKEIKEVELKSIKEDIVEIKLILKKIDTYLSTTSSKHPK
ncbi:MAG TPA: hypothetical protein VF473_00315 [Cyclobacteriaceae bacterium]